MEAQLSPDAIVLSGEAVQRARETLRRRQELGHVPRIQSAYARLRRMRDETQNLLVDLHALRHMRDRPGPAAFLVPHTNTFDAFVNPDEQLEKFLFSEFEPDTTQEERKRVLFQLADLFKLWAAGQPNPRFHNVLLDVSIEELKGLGEALGTGVRRSQQDVIASAFGSETTHPPEALDQLLTLTAELEDIASGFWRPKMLEFSNIRTRMSEVSQALDTKISAALETMLEHALHTNQRRARLQSIFSDGDFYRLNSCPDLPESVRRIYAEIAQSARFRTAFETLTGQLGDTIAELNAVRFENSRPKRDPQIARDARLLATIHVANLLLESSAGEGLSPSIQLVTNAERIADVVAAFPGSSLRVPVRHPRLLAWVLNDDLVQELDRPLSIAVALLDDFVVQADRTGNITRASIQGLWKDLAEPWSAVTENLVVGSASLAPETSAAATPQMAKAMARRRVNSAPAELQRRALRSDPRDVTPDERKFAFARLDVLSAVVAQQRLFGDRASARAKRLDNLGFALVPATQGPEGSLAIPLEGQLPYAVFIPARRLRARPSSGDSSLTFRELRRTLDGSTQKAVRASSEPHLADIMANRLTFVLSAMASSNWPMALAISTYAVDRFGRSEAEHTDEAKQLLEEILFARQLAARGVAALSRANPSAQIAHLLSAWTDLETIEELDPGDVSVILARAALSNELLVLEATLARDGAGTLPSETVPIQPLDTIRRLADLKRTLGDGAGFEDRAGTHADYVLFRTLEYLMASHLIIWSGEADFVLIPEVRESALTEFDWGEIFAEFQQASQRMREWRHRLAPGASDQEATPFPFAEFLLLYGQFAIDPRFAGARNAGAPQALDAAQDFFDRYAKMDARCEELSENGFARRLARAAKVRILSSYREAFLSDMTRAFDRLVPASNVAWSN